MSDKNWPWLDKVNAYFAAAYVPYRTDQQVGAFIRLVCRWWLEFARNVLVVATLGFLAEKSDSTSLKAFAIVTSIALIAYLSTYQQHGSFTFFPYIKRPRLRFWANSIVTLLVYAALIGAWWSVFNNALNALAKVVGR